MSFSSHLVDFWALSVSTHLELGTKNGKGGGEGSVCQMMSYFMSYFSLFFVAYDKMPDAR